MTDDQQKLFEQACFIRAFEHELAVQFDQGEVPGLLHLCTGAEVAETLLAYALDSEKDVVTGSHRSHGLALAMGADPVLVAMEILGRKGGLSDGLAGTQHIIAPEAGFLTSNGIVGGQVPLAAGAALTAKTQKTGGIAVAVFGEGAANQGAVLETMNLAVSLKLPLLFVLENNGFAQSTPQERVTGDQSYADRAKGFGLGVFEADSIDAAACLDCLQQAVSHVRGGLPTFVEVYVSRLNGHYHTDDELYRFNKNDFDPLIAWEQKLLADGMPEPADETESDTWRSAREVVAQALAAEKAGPAQLALWVGASG